MSTTMLDDRLRALLDGPGLQPALLPFGESTMLPAAAYTSPDVFGWEQRNFFAGTWTCIGRVEDVLGANGMTQRALAVGDVPVVVARDASGALGASTAGLARLPLDVWHGWVFVNALADPVRSGSFPDHIGGMADLVAPYAPERLVLAARHDYVVAANWKVVTENYHECYHCPLIHPELCQVSPPASGQNYDLPGAWVGGSMDLRDGAVTMSLDGTSTGAPIAGVDPRVVLYLGLFPNLLVSLHPDYVMTHRMTPLSPGRTAVECSWYLVPPVADASFAVDFWDRTNRQDWGACESVQRGLGSPHFRPGPLAPNEDAVHQFVTMVARGYLGQPLAG